MIRPNLWRDQIYELLRYPNICVLGSYVILTTCTGLLESGLECRQRPIYGPLQHFYVEIWNKICERQGCYREKEVIHLNNFTVLQDLWSWDLTRTHIQSSPCNLLSNWLKWRVHVEPSNMTTIQWPVLTCNAPWSQRSSSQIYSRVIQLIQVHLTIYLSSSIRNGIIFFLYLHPELC